MKRNFNFLNVKKAFPHFSQKLDISLKLFTSNLKYIHFTYSAIAVDLKLYLQDIYVA